MDTTYKGMEEAMKLPEIRSGIETRRSPIRERLERRGIRGWGYGYVLMLAIAIDLNALWAVFWFVALRHIGDTQYKRAALGISNTLNFGAALAMLVSA